ncbi:lysophospholipid acyltransferase family protein [Glaesserella sp.]|uniref:lysophospholipid acyltransferase family protein n=1 Tax=Glaesserella sp. TaxID=2094731 RepID=UPI00359FF2FA
MKRCIKKALAWLTNHILCRFVSFLTGIRTKSPYEMAFEPGRKVYYANHSSHGDFILVWNSLPARWRLYSRPVAAAEYWQSGRIKRFIIESVFNGLLIPRQSDDPKAITEQMTEALKDHSLIIFPEGTRNTDENIPLLPFKTGIYYLAKRNPDVQFVPIWIHNINRVLPKGKWLPVPLLCEVRIGEPLQWNGGEEKQAFLDRTQAALLALAPERKEAV